MVLAQVGETVKRGTTCPALPGEDKELSVRMALRCAVCDEMHGQADSR